MRNAHQEDLFDKPIFEIREPAERLDLDRFRLRLKGEMSRALTECGESREAIAERLAGMPGFGATNRGMLDAWCSPAKAHDITLVRFKALARAVRAPWLWDLVVSDEGLLVLAGDEARLAEIAALQQRRRELSRRLAALTSRPVALKR